MSSIAYDDGILLSQDRMFSANITSGEEIFHTFCRETGIDKVSSISFFDHHNVIDAVANKQIAAKIGIELDHLEDHGSVLLSYSPHRSWRRWEAFQQFRKCFPLINEMDGYVFTDVRHNANTAVTVYQEDWMKWKDRDDKGHLKCSIIGVAGDKGQIAELFGIPAIIFDDKENNVRKVMQAGGKNAGCVVRLGSKMGHEVRRQTRLDRKFLELTNHYDLFLYSQYFRNHVQRPYCTAISAIAHSQ